MEQFDRNTDNIYFSTQKRQSLKSSAKTVLRVTNFLTQLQRSFSKFDRICTTNKDYNIEIITAMGDMMTDLAGLYRAVGGSSAAEEISDQGEFTKKVVVSSTYFLIINLLILSLFSPISKSLKILT